MTGNTTFDRRHLRIAVIAVAAVGSWLAAGTATAGAVPLTKASVHSAAHATAKTQSRAHSGVARGATKHVTTHTTTGKASSSNGASTTASGHVTRGTAGTSGDPTQPQPISRGDQNSGGANGQCTGATYCSTRDGSPSGNGNGGGKATGKPCAGCVGKADNKNPPGQEKTDPRGTFPNNGYECDNNNGIGKTNPAHTGCTGTPPPCPSGEVMNDSGDCVPPPCPDGEVMVAGDCVPPPCDASVEDCGSNPPPACVPTAANNFCSTVEGEHHSRNPQTEPTTKVLGEKVVRTPGALPFTGAAGLGALLAAAAIALGVGSGLSVAARRRRRTG